MRALWMMLLMTACAVPPTSSDPDPSGDDDDNPPTDCHLIDEDDDGYNACIDCDDNDPLRYPGAPERCNGIDDDCDGELAPGEEDSNGDGAPDCLACDAAGFWEATRELEGPDLIDKVTELVQPQTCSGYSATTTWMFTMLDRDPVTGQVECLYTGRTVVVGNVKPDPTDMNTEHTWPQSLGAGQEPARCDLHHLFPCDAHANNVRANYPFDYVAPGTVTWEEGGSALGQNASGQIVFEPRDEKKGDIARGMVYFATRYGHALSLQEISIYKDWDALDPVDEAEIARTMAIADHQVLANPFVACPRVMDAL